MEKSNGGLLFAALIVAALLPVIFANPEGRVTVSNAVYLLIVHGLNCTHSQPMRRYGYSWVSLL